jgi:hypothetical protein
MCTFRRRLRGLLLRGVDVLTAQIDGAAELPDADLLDRATELGPQNQNLYYLCYLYLLQIQEQIFLISSTVSPLLLLCGDTIMKTKHTFKVGGTFC